MRKVLWKVISEDHGQDLVEYALVVVLIATAVSATMTTVASNISNIFIAIGGKMNPIT